MGNRNKAFESKSEKDYINRLIMHLRKLLDDREEVNEKAIALLQGKIRPTAWDVL